MHTATEKEALATTIEDTYPLSPMQQGLLYNTLLEPESGVDIEQLLFELHEALDVPAFQSAWRCVIARHPVLRTNLRWENLAEPLQEVRAQVELPWEEQDWRGIASGERSERMEGFLRADRRRGFELTRAPLFRLTLLRYGEEEFHLVWTFHHTVLEGPSYALALREVFAFYEAIRQGKEISLPLPRPYRDYIDWSKKQDFSKSEAFWRETLKGFTVPTPLAIDHAPDGYQDSRVRMGTHEVLLSTTITSALRALAQDNQLTLNTIVQGAWALLLSRYSSEEDVVFGVIRGSRRSTIEGAEAMIGLFLNTLPLRVRVNSEAELFPWLNEVRLQWMAMREHEHTPLANVHGWSEMEGGSPLFQSTMAFENYHLDTMLRKQGGAWSNRRFRLLLQTNNPLNLTAYEGAELRLRIDFDRHRIDDAAAARIIGQVRTLLEAIAISPHQKVGEISLLTSAERHELLVEWNDTATDDPAAAPIHELFEAQVARTPEAVAVVSDGRTLSYGELDRRANQVAHALRKRGVGTDALVALCVNRSPGMIVALLGVLKAGGAYVPLDPEYPAERLAFMLKDCGAKLLITEDCLRTKLSPLPVTCEVMYLDRDAEALAAEPQHAPRSKVDLSSLAYAIYTSGSTGQPKAALLTHRGLSNLAANESRLYGIGPHSRVLQFSSLSFDASLSEIAMALCSGATLYVEARDAILPGPDLEGYLEREKITVLSLTPSALAVLDPAAAPSVEQLIVGGESCPADLAARWAGRCRFFNTYGPTEATIVATYIEYRDGTRPPNIGRPLPNVRVYLLDRKLEPVPVGLPGELYIGGVGVARGYLNRPELTAERFLPDPFCGRRGALMYRSGDFARWRPDGQIEFIGRIDNQVKIRGYRIELGEIEAGIVQHPEVSQVVVIAREDTPGDKCLVAYVVAENPAADLADQLRAHLKLSLPEYMVPSAFVTLDKLPLTPNGKVDHKALPPPERSASQQADYVAPRTLTEEALAAIWCKLLELEQVGVHDNFFELGGHSLMLVRLIGEIDRTFNVKLGVPLLFINPTVEQMASLIDSQRQRDKQSSTVIQMAEGGTEPPVYFINPELREFRVAREMGEGRAVFGIETRWPLAWRSALADNRKTDYPTLEQVVSPYVAALSAHARSSPCVIAGYSLSGLMAFEAARQFQKLGGKVELVILIDALGPPPNPFKFAWHIWRQSWKQPANRLSIDKTLQSFDSRVRGPWRTGWWLLGKAKNRLWSYLNRPETGPETGIDRPSHFIDEHGMPLPWSLLIRLCNEIDETYRPTSLDSRGVLFRATRGQQVAVRTYDETLGWKDLFTRGLEIIQIPGDHFSIFRDHSPMIAQEISRLLK